jgi:hypothetical protein
LANAYTYSFESIWNKVTEVELTVMTRYNPWPKVVDFLHALPEYALVADIGCGNGKRFVAGRRKRRWKGRKREREVYGVIECRTICSTFC